jgi:hypothetical protein
MSYAMLGYGALGESMDSPLCTKYCNPNMPADWKGEDYCDLNCPDWSKKYAGVKTTTAMPKCCGKNASSMSTTQIQTELKKLGISWMAQATPGKWDEATFKGVVQFQKAYGLSVDGIFGAQSEKMLRAVMKDLSAQYDPKTMAPAPKPRAKAPAALAPPPPKAPVVAKASMMPFVLLGVAAVGLIGYAALGSRQRAASVRT